MYAIAIGLCLFYAFKIAHYAYALDDLDQSLLTQEN